MKEMISIIVPVYNARATLERCIASLRKQTYENIEIILVNDGSKDDSLSICNRFAAEDPRIRVIDKPNGGVSSARNAGLDAAKGEFIMFCDSDDWVEPDWCSSMRSSYREECLSVCELDWVNRDVEYPRQPEESVERKYYLHHSNVMCPPYNKIFSAAVIQKKRIRFLKELSLGEDFVFCLTYLCAISGCVRYLGEPLYHYDTSNENSLSEKTPALDQCEIFYRAVTEAMQTLNALDAVSVYVRNTLIAPHYERNLKGIARNRTMSFWEKMAAAKSIGACEGFRNTCRDGIRWGNPVYLWLMQRNCVRLGMLYLLTVLRIKKRI